MFGKKKSPGKSARKKETGRRILELFSRRAASDEAFFEDLEDLLVESDFGAAAAVNLVDELRSEARKSWSREELLARMKEILAQSIHGITLAPNPRKTTIYLVLGVNGVGKTTTIAKLAHRFLREGAESVVFAAGDTFRAAAAEQLGIHAQKVGARLVKQAPGADPAAVIYDAMTSARSRGEKLIIADTAGRMHNRVNLVKELEKIDRIIREKMGPDSEYMKLLVIDATTGQNGLRQAETFHEAVGVDALILTKYDSSARGGLAAAIGGKLGLPFAFIGRGEGMDDLVPFDTAEYLDELLSSG